MQNVMSADTDRPVVFGQRKISPRVCVIDGKRHIRSFLGESLEQFGCVVALQLVAGEVVSIPDLSFLDLVVLGIPSGGVDAERILKSLAAQSFEGRVLLIGRRQSLAVGAVQQLGEALGLTMLPVLATPFNEEALRASVAMVLPRERSPRPVIDASEALQADWLELWHEVKVDVWTLAACGAEATVRVRHPFWGVVVPAGFVADAGDPHLMALSEFVMRRVINDWRYFVHRHGPIGISIDMQVHRFVDPVSIDRLRTVPDHPAFGGLTIRLKAAEVINCLDVVTDVAGRLRLHNIAVALDDLGTDWPTLMERSRFPFAEVKVAPELVTGCAENRLQQVVCRGIAELAQGYGARAVAKGVETSDDLEVIRRLGFPLAQGGLFGRPAVADKFTRATLSQPMTHPVSLRS